MLKSMNEMSSQETKIRNAIETQRANGFTVTTNVWFTFRDGRTPPSVSPWGAILWTLHSTKSGNFIIPGKGIWWKSVLDHLEVDQDWADHFVSGFDAVNNPNLDINNPAYLLGQKLRLEYIPISQ